MLLNKETVCKYFKKTNDFSSYDKTFSPFYSNIGLEVNPDRNGSGALWLHYNRSSRKMWSSFLDFPLSQNKNLSTSWCAIFGEKKDEQVKITFTDTDTVFVAANGINKIKIFAEPDKNLLSFWTEELSDSTLSVRGFSKNTDDRDPDEAVPFYAKFTALNGFFLNKNGENFISSENGKIVFSAAFEILEINEENAEKKLKYSPERFCKAEEKCREIILGCLKDFELEAPDEETAELTANALHGLIFNLAKAPGDLKHHISSFPSRGAYPTHFLWDTCFQNLAYEEMNTFLAKEFLLQFAQCQRSDGKYVQFICSTWGRPDYSQPALVGWAVMRLYEKTKDKKFLEIMLVSIEKNNSWWLTSRASECGLIYCPHGLETGQDDSPRFDNGTTFACDMNSYVLNQLNLTVKICEELGEKERADKWKKQAQKLSDAMIKYLYCEEENIFYDLHPETKKHVKIISPVSFLPLWAGVNLPKEKAEKSIKKYLLNPEYLFGEVPFPSVAYNDALYEEDGWWRGPTWMPNAWLMLETLKKFGYENEMLSAAQKLLNVIVKDKKMHELFNSKTGAGLGASQQGWTCAIFIKLCKILNK